MRRLYSKKTLLHTAAQRGDADMVEALLDANVEIDATDRAGATPLHYAVLNDHIPAATLLLEQGADAGARLSAFAAVQDSSNRVGPMPDSYGAAGGKTPLDLAKSPAMKSLLREHGASE